MFGTDESVEDSEVASWVTEGEGWTCEGEEAEGIFELKTKFSGLDEFAPTVLSKPTGQTCKPGTENDFPMTLGLNTLDFPSPHLFCGSRINYFDDEGRTSRDVNKWEKGKETWFFMACKSWVPLLGTNRW